MARGSSRGSSPTRSTATRTQPAPAPVRQATPVQ